MKIRVGHEWYQFPVLLFCLGAYTFKKKFKGTTSFKVDKTGLSL
jgi:hypothetical protein